MNPQEQINSEFIPKPIQPKIKNQKNNYKTIAVILAILAAFGFTLYGFELWQNAQKENKINELQLKAAQNANNSDNFNVTDETINNDDISKNEETPKDEFVLHFSNYVFSNSKENNEVNFYKFDEQNCTYSQHGECNEAPLNKSLLEFVSKYQCETSSCKVWQWEAQQGTAIAGNYAVIYEGVDYYHGKFEYCVVYDIKNEKTIYRGDNDVALTLSEYHDAIIDTQGKHIANLNHDGTVYVIGTD